MYKVIVGLVVGIVIGILFGTSVVAPRLQTEKSVRSDNQTDTEALTPQSSHGVGTSLGGSPESVTLSVSSGFSMDTPAVGKVLDILVEDIQRISGSKLAISFQEPETLVSVGEISAALSSQAIDAAFVSLRHLEPLAPSIRIASGLPFGHSAQKMALWVNQGSVRKRVNDAFPDAMIQAIPCGLELGFTGGWFSSEINSPTDLADKNIHAKGLAATLLREAGVQVVEHPAQQAIDALANGTIDGLVLGPVASDYRQGAAKGARVLYTDGWHRRSTLLVLALQRDIWNSLTPPLQAGLESACHNAVSNSLKLGIEAHFDALKSISADGVDVRRLPDNVAQILEEHWSKIVAAWLQEDAQFAAEWQALEVFTENHEIWEELQSR